MIGRLRENIRELNYNVLDFARVQCHCLANVHGLLSFWLLLCRKGTMWSSCGGSYLR